MPLFIGSHNKPLLIFAERGERTGKKSTTQSPASKLASHDEIGFHGFYGRSLHASNPMHFLVGHAAVQIKVAVRQAHNRRPAATVYLSILRRTAVRVVRPLRRRHLKKCRNPRIESLTDRARSLARSGAREATEV